MDGGGTVRATRVTEWLDGQRLPAKRPPPPHDGAFEAFIDKVRCCFVFASCVRLFCHGLFDTTSIFSFVFLSLILLVLPFQATRSYNTFSRCVSFRVSLFCHGSFDTTLIFSMFVFFVDFLLHFKSPIFPLRLSMCVFVFVF